MKDRAPRVSVGLPVRNGEAFLADALESLQAQTFSDFEVIISDNASEDRTEEICREVAAGDSRFFYHRSEKNLGAAPNFNRTFHLARGEYFRWAAHDDTTHPEFLERCVEVLDSDPSVVLCHSRVRIFGERGAAVEDHEYPLATGSEDPRRRFFDLLFIKNRCFEVFGLIRSRVLRETGLIGAYPVGDRVLLSELAFRGRFHEIPDPLFYSGDHEDRSVRSNLTQQKAAAWIDARYAERITFPEWRTFYEYCRAISGSPLKGLDRVMAYLYMVKWLRHYRKRMRQDLVVAARTWITREVGAA